jgi:hypothetical protein
MSGNLFRGFQVVRREAARQGSNGNHASGQNVMGHFQDEGGVDAARIRDRDVLQFAQEGTEAFKFLFARSM